MKAGWKYGGWLLFFLARGVFGEGLEEGVESFRRDIVAAERRLGEVRLETARIESAEAAEIEELGREVAGLRAEARRLREAEGSRSAGLAGLAEEVETLRRDEALAASALAEFVLALDGRLSVPERGRFEPWRSRFLGAADDGERLDLLAPLLEAAAGRDRARFGGLVEPGTCLDAAGIEVEGTLVRVGPALYFLGADGGAAGTAAVDPAVGLPRLVSALPPETVAALAEGKTADVPVDVTAGRVGEGGDSWVRRLRAGGPLMVPLLLLGLAVAVTTAIKAVALGRLKSATAMQAAAVVADLKAGNRLGASYRCRVLGFPAGDLLAEGVSHARAGRGELSEILESKILVLLPRLERGLSVLSVTAAVAPLLGLLGTVMGMIHAFENLAVRGAGPASAFSGGISEALITTEYGLAIGIPALLLHAVFSRWIKATSQRLENLALDFIQAVTGGNGA